MVSGSIVLGAMYVHSPNLSRAISALMLGVGASLMRPDGFEQAAVLMLVLVAFAVRRQDWRVVVATATAMLLAYGLWTVVARLAIHVHATTYSPSLGRLAGLVNLSYVSELVLYLGRQLLNAYIFGPLVVALLIVALRRPERDQVFALLVLGADLVVMSAVYLVLPSTNEQPLWWWLRTGFDRILMHFVPVAYGVAAIALAQPLGMALAAMKARAVHQLPTPGSSPAARTTLLVATLVAITITIGLTGPADVDLATIEPAAVENSSAVSYGAHWIQASPTGRNPIVITYFLDNISERVPPEGNYWGHFTAITATVTGPGTFTIVTSRSTETIAVADNRPHTLALSIPPFAQKVALEAILPTETSTARWDAPKLHRDGLWLVATFLLLVATGSIALTTSLARQLIGQAVPLADWAPTVTSLALTACLAIQAADALISRALPVWASALFQLAKLLRNM
jgi:hypothetical protein